MASNKVAVVALFVIAMLVVASTVPVTEAGYNCVDNCVERCSNGKNLGKCTSMCEEACTANVATGLKAEELFGK